MSVVAIKAISLIDSFGGEFLTQAIEGLELPSGNKGHTVARAGTTGFVTSSHRAADLQPRHRWR